MPFICWRAWSGWKNFIPFVKWCAIQGYKTIKSLTLSNGIYIYIYRRTAAILPQMQYGAVQTFVQLQNAWNFLVSVNSYHIFICVIIRTTTVEWQGATQCHMWAIWATCDNTIKLFSSFIMTFFFFYFYLHLNTVPVPCHIRVFVVGRAYSSSEQIIFALWHTHTRVTWSLSDGANFILFHIVIHISRMVMYLYASTSTRIHQTNMAIKLWISQIVSVNTFCCTPNPSVFRMQELCSTKRFFELIKSFAAIESHFMNADRLRCVACCWWPNQF